MIGILLLTISLFAAAQAVGNCGESEGVALCAPSTVTVSLHIEQTTMFRRANLFYPPILSSTTFFSFLILLAITNNLKSSHRPFSFKHIVRHLKI